jgi:ribosomal subunit interface protein
MQISVSGKHIDVGAALSEHVERELNESVKKYFEHAVSAGVILSKLRHCFSANIVVNDGTGTHQILRANGEAGDAYAAFDQALERIKTQLRRYKGKIKNHHKEKLEKDVDTAAYIGTKYVLSALEEDEDKDTEKDAPLIIAEKPAHIETLSVSDAVMRMDLGALPALMFINKKTGNINAIYRREDGNISWIDPGAIGSVQSGRKRHAA